MSEKAKEKEYGILRAAVRKILKGIYSSNCQAFAAICSEDTYLNFDGISARGNEILKVIAQIRKDGGTSVVKRITCESLQYLRIGDCNVVMGRYHLEAAESSCAYKEYSYLIILLESFVECIIIHSVPTPNRIIKIVATNESVYFWRESDVLYVESMRDHALWHGMSGEIESAACLKNVQKQLSGDFLRIHRSYLINTNRIISIQRCSVTMHNGECLPIPYKKYTQIKAQLCERGER